MKQRQRYTEEFKREVLQMAASGKKAIAALEHDLGITPGLVYKWRHRYEVNGTNGKLRPSQERESEAEIRRLKRELEIVRQERDILKKAIRIFSQEPK
jgi:transposase